MVDASLCELAGRIVTVPGVVAVLLGGSRARGEHTATSDVDLGLYYRPPLDVGALARLARQVSGPQAEVTEPAGELALGVVLADPTGEVTALQEQTQQYPPLLTAALRDGLWEATFLVKAAAKGLPRADATYVAGSLFRAVQLCAAALHGQAGRWLVNEKGAVWSAGRLPGAPRDFERRAHAVLGGLGTTEGELARALSLAAELVDDTVAACLPSQTRTNPSGGTGQAGTRA